jgi:hypothetical protein
MGVIPAIVIVIAALGLVWFLLQRTAEVTVTDGPAAGAHTFFVMLFIFTAIAGIFVGFFGSIIAWMTGSQYLPLMIAIFVISVVIVTVFDSKT